MKFGLKKKEKSIKDQFVLSIGDEGAIFCHFDNGKLANKLFIDSPASPDIKLLEKLLVTYSKTPVYVLVDVIEQNYSQQVLPPVSSFGIRSQVQRRIKRDFQPNDFTNVFLVNRSKEGRKDWNFLFVSLANSDPFAKWLEIILNHNNSFKGVYLLPLESTKLIEDIDKSILESPSEEWELLVLHNKVGGFRIVAFKNGKLIFTRLAQNLIGDNIPDIIVGNMEQEISNTVEYLRRLAFKGEADSKITIIAGTEILQKVDIKNLKFGSVHLFTPSDVAVKLNFPESVSEKDKFSDILVATHFASNRRHVLKFNSPYTKKLETLYTMIRGACILFACLLFMILSLIGSEILDIRDAKKEMESATVNLDLLKSKEKELREKKDKLPAEVDKLLDIMRISKNFPEDRFLAIRVIDKISPQFNESHIIDNIKMTVERGDPIRRTITKFHMEISMKFLIDATQKDSLATMSDVYIKDFAKLVPKYKVIYSAAPKVEQSQFEKVTNGQDTGSKDNVAVPAKITISGDL